MTGAPALGLLTPALLALGCGELLPDEAVLGDEVPAVILDGEAGSRLGAAVAVGTIDGEARVAVAAPDAGEVRVLDSTGAELWRVQGEDGLGRGLAIEADAVWALAPGQGVVQLEAGAATLVLEAPEAAQLAVCVDGSMLTSPDPSGAVACGPELQALHSRCAADSCEVSLDDEPLATTSAGSAVGFADGVACWGDAALTEDDAPGVVSCADGRAVDGLVGDHLGRSLADGFAAGVFNKWVVPARARIVPLGGGSVLAVDRAAEATRLALAADDSLLVVGVPGYGARDAGEGRVFLVERGQLP